MRLTSTQKKISIVAIGILLILSLNFFTKEVKGFFYSISAPIQKLFWNAGDDASDYLADIFKGENLKKENEELKTKLQELLFGLAHLEELEKENLLLRDSLALGLQKEFKLTLAEIIGKDIAQDYIILNKGLRDGISKDMPVVTGQKALAGKIAEVYDEFSRVLLISNKQSVFDAEIAGKDISGVVAGQGGAKLNLEFVPQDKDIREGDLVVSSSLGGIYPQGLLAGLVKMAEKSDIKPFQQVEISPFFDIKESQKLFIIED